MSHQCWHPTLRRLLSQGPLSSTSQFSDSSSTTGGPEPTIDDIWLLDDIHHGASVDLNAGLLGNVHGWSDGGRDVLNLIEHVLPSLDGGQAGEVLGWKEGGKGKKVVGIGHSVGGNAMSVFLL